MPKPIPLPRLASVPPADPPYDDERGPHVDPHATYGSLALAHEPRVYGDHGEHGAAGAREGLVIAPRGSAPDERRLRGLGQAMAEILSGRRPPEAVQNRLSERAYRGLVRAGKMIDTQRPPMVGLPHVQQPVEGVVEMCVLVHCGERSRVLALRLERFGVQWLVTDFETA
jgi:hypothetical protein